MQNDDAGVLNRHRNDIKVLPYISQTAGNINNNDETENDMKQSNKYCIEDYEDFARRCRKSTVILIIVFFFRTVVWALTKYLHVGNLDDITHSMVNLNLDIQKMQRSQRTRKPNRQY